MGKQGWADKSFEQNIKICEDITIDIMILIYTCIYIYIHIMRSIHGMSVYIYICIDIFPLRIGFDYQILCGSQELGISH